MNLYVARKKGRKKVCNDDRKIYMMQSVEFSRIVNYCRRLANHGRVLEGVADKLFFLPPFLAALIFFVTAR